MCARQIEHFREVFEAIRHEINFGMDLTVTHMRESPNTIPDENDRASKESEFTIELRERDRDRNLLSKVVRALGAHSNRRFRLLRIVRRSDRARPPARAPGHQQCASSASACRNTAKKLSPSDFPRRLRPALGALSPWPILILSPAIPAAPARPR